MLSGVPYMGEDSARLAAAAGNRRIAPARQSSLMGRTREVRRVAQHFAALPDLNVLVAGQSREAVLASKFVAFPASVATRNRLRYRDVWDMH